MLNICNVKKINTHFPQVNPNCDAVACYNGLEKPDMRQIPVAFISNETFSPEFFYSSEFTSQLFDWYTNFIFALQNSSCQEAYNNEFDATKKCKEAMNLTACQAQVLDLQNALSYINAELQSSTSVAVSGSIGLGACLRNANGEYFSPDIQKLTQTRSDSGSFIRNSELSAIYYQ